MSDYKVDYAASGRSACKKCQGKIAQGTLRIGKMVQAVQFDGLYPVWHHVSCFFARYGKEVGPHSAPLFHGLENVRWEDQESIRAQLGAPTITTGDPAPAADAPAKKGQKKPAARGKKRKAEEELVPEEDNTKKMRLDPEEEQRLKALSEQTKRLYEIRDKLDADLNNDELKEMLELNGHSSRGGRATLLDACAEGMLFGAIPSCPECQHHSLKCDDGILYKCHGLLLWGSCTFESTEIERQEWQVIDCDSDFLSSFTFELTVPVKKKATKSVPRNGASSSNLTFDAQDPIPKPIKTLFSPYVIASAGSLSRTQKDLRALITKHGGSFATSITKKVNFVISTKEAVDARESAKSLNLSSLLRYLPHISEKVVTALDRNLPVVTEAYLDDCIAQSALLGDKNYILSGNLRDTLIATAAEKEKTIQPMEKDNDSSIQTWIVKGGVAVDPDSGLAEDGQILQKGKNVYTAMLSISDVSKGRNSYYGLQIIEQNKSYSLFRKWGRVGTTIGGNKLEWFDDKHDAIDAFCKLYLEKTGNDWEDRDNFQKQPGLMFPMELDYGDEEAIVAIDKASSQLIQSSLPSRLADLMSLIFDAMQRTLRELQIDTNRMPLGKLSKNQLLKGYTVLSTIQSLLETPDTPKSQYIAATNQFNTLIPHYIPAGAAIPTIDNSDILAEKTKMLDALMEMEVASSILKSGKGEQDMLSSHYNKLNCNLTPLDKESHTYKLICEYVSNTHAPTHTTYLLEVEDVFVVNRDTEFDAFQEHNDIAERKLLWHGSRLTNFAGILSQGLRIAPPEAPVTGYMFGKGIYFADMVSKSANYCFTSPNDPVGLMLLSEVAVGNPWELRDAKFVKKLKAQYHSVKGCGKTCPHPDGDVPLSDDPDDHDHKVIVHKGLPMQARAGRTSLLYNEYIVYKTNQVRLRYLLKVRFNYAKNKK